MTVIASWITRRPHPDGIEACIRDTNVNVWGLVRRRRQGADDDRILRSVHATSSKSARKPAWRKW
jgi:uncharacterized protein (DUF433 family)